MTLRILAILFVSLLLTASGCVAGRIKEAHYVITNSFSEEIQVEVYSPNGKSLSKKSVKPNREILLGRVRRLVIHKAGEAHEYALPSNLRVKTSPQANRSEPYMLMLGGQWRISMMESNYLDVACVKGGDLPVVVDHTKPPLGFPLRPRKSDETFEQYKASIEEIYRAALTK